MCGLVGIVNLNGESVREEVLEKMTRIIAHRGPDGVGLYKKDFIGLGHRRLAILDLRESGNQPMFSPDQRFVIVYNGEVYNYIDIRNELIALGYKFYTDTDTEVVLSAFIEWGQDSVKKFNGMFALAIWDSRDQTIFLARDRYGIKPLYYFYNDQKIIFASEIKSIYASGELRAQINQDALPEYFTFQNVLREHTFFKGINLLPPAHTLSINVRKKSFEKKRYWQYNFIQNHNLTENDCIEEASFLLEQAVKRQLISDVPVGSYLSGGIDSGMLTALASRNIARIKTFTCGFDVHGATENEILFDERKVAEAISYQYNTQHYEMVLKSSDMEDVMPSLSWHQEELRVGQSYPNFYIAELASKFVKVCLSGTGGDELFGGYPWRFFQNPDAKNFNEYLSSYYRYWQRLIPHDDLKGFLSPIVNAVNNHNPYESFLSFFDPDLASSSIYDDYINASFSFEAQTFLQGLFLVEDKVSMAHSLEVRVPFLDNDLVDFAMKIPVKFKFKSNSQKIDSNQYNDHGKVILRKLSEKYLPKNIASGRKQGFSSPDETWFRNQSRLFVEQRLLKKDNPIYEFISYSYVEESLKRHMNQEKNSRLLIWSLLNFSEICKCVENNFNNI